jgi:hypothetical protein
MNTPRTTFTLTAAQPKTKQLMYRHGDLETAIVLREHRQDFLQDHHHRHHDHRV